MALCRFALAVYGVRFPRRQSQGATGGDVEAGQPHIANHDYAERVHGLIEPLGQFRAARHASSGITLE